MAAPSYKDTKEKLIEIMRGSIGTGSRDFDIAKAILDIKAQEGIKRATWALAFATFGLIIMSIAQIMVALK